MDQGWWKEMNIMIKILNYALIKYKFKNLS